MKTSEKAEKLADKIASSGAIFVYRPSMFTENYFPTAVPVQIYAESFARLLNYRFENSEKGIDTREGVLVEKMPRVVSVPGRYPPTDCYENGPKNLLLAIDMGGLDRFLLNSLLESFSKFSRYAVTSDEEFYKKNSFDVIHVEDEAGLIHVLFGATELLKEKLPPLKTVAPTPPIR